MFNCFFISNYSVHSTQWPLHGMCVLYDWDNQYKRPEKKTWSECNMSVIIGNTFIIIIINILIIQVYWYIHDQFFFCRSEKWLHYFWQEFFSAVRIITDFAFIFVLELLRFVFHYVLLRILGGIIIVVGDHFLKPYLALVFNRIIQPTLIFTRNVLTGIRNLLQPLMDISSVFIAQLGSLLRAFRLFELNWKPVYERGQKHDVHVL